MRPRKTKASSESPEIKPAPVPKELKFATPVPEEFWTDEIQPQQDFNPVTVSEKPDEIYISTDNCFIRLTRRPDGKWSDFISTSLVSNGNLAETPGQLLRRGVANLQLLQHNIGQVIDAAAATLIAMENLDAAASDLPEEPAAD